MIRGLIILSLVFGLSALSYNSFPSRASGPDLSTLEVAEEKTYQFSEEELGYFDEEITSLMLRTRFNGQVFVARHGTILYNRCFGFSDFRNSTALTEETPFQLASISKTFTSTAVLLLHQEGKLNIDSLVLNYIPEFPYPDITVRHLLNHTSGLQNYMWVMERYWTQSRMPSNEDMLATFIKHKRPLDFVPGTRWAYSNTGFAVLGLLVERVSGQRFPDFLQARIFQPLGMLNTFVYDVHQDHQPEQRAFGFRPARGRYAFIPDVSHDGVMGDKGVFSTAADLYKWDQAIYRNELLTPELWHLAFEKARLKNTNTVNYGMGWRLQSFRDHRIVHHPGRWNGFRTSFKRYIDDDATLIILSNTNQNIASLVDRMQEIIFSRELLMEPDLLDVIEDENEAMQSGSGG
ncbi:MAG: serine hydrolase domain-containing protein [Bacteroides sp.]|nr:serine hydrolase domain-containing protein [Bacteroides sp.]